MVIGNLVKKTQTELGLFTGFDYDALKFNFLTDQPPSFLQLLLLRRWSPCLRHNAKLSIWT